MTLALLAAVATEQHPRDWLAGQGRIFAAFDASTQDSGNVSVGVRIDGRQFFVKTAGDPTPAPGEPIHYLAHPATVTLLRTAEAIGRSCSHPAAVRYLHTVESPVGPVLVHDWAHGELLHAPAGSQRDPATARRRFAALPTQQLLAAFHALIDLHVELAGAGWITEDLYDGCLLYDCTAEPAARFPTVTEFADAWGSRRHSG